MQKCKVCGTTDFYKEDGYFFCQRCQTQNQDIREEVLDTRIDSTTRLKTQKIRSSRSGKSGEIVGWTSWELYNFILIGLTDELISLGVTQDIKLTILQLWATYLQKLEVAFFSTKKTRVPKLSRRYNKRDAEIIYGKLKLKKRTRKRKKPGSSASTSMVSGCLSDVSSTRNLNRSKKLFIAADYDNFMQSQGSSEGDALSLFSQSLYSVKSTSGKSSDNEEKIRFNNSAKLEAKKVKKLSKKLPRNKRVKYRQSHITTQYKIGPQIITPMKLWAILYIGLRIHDEPIHLCDMLRYAREGHLSYYKLDHLLPAEVNITQSDMNLLLQNTELTHKGMRRLIATMAKFLKVYELVGDCPDIMTFVNRFCQELELPRGVSLYVERFISLSPPKMKFDMKSAYIPNYEGRVMAFIMVVLKLLFCLDGITEYEISKIAERINSVGSEKGVLDSKLFSFREWQRFIECRRTVLSNLHFPTKLKYQHETHGASSLYIKFLEGIHAKNSEREEPEVTSYRHLIPKDLANAMKRCITSLNYNNMPLKEVDMFAPSLTPLYTYLRQLMQHPLHTLPTVLQSDFFLTKVGYLTNWEHLQELAAQCDIQVQVIESNLHFLEKIVPQFERIKIASIDEMKNDVTVHDDDAGVKTQTVKVEDINEYVQWKMPSKVKIHVVKEMYYSDTVKSKVERHKYKIDDDDNFAFNMTTPSGKLLISNHDDSNNECGKDFIDTTLCTENGSSPVNLCKQLCKKYGIQLTTYEKDSTEIIETENDRNVSIKDINSLRKHRATNSPRDLKGRFTSRRSATENLNMSHLSNLDIDIEEQDPLDPFRKEVNYTKNARLKSDLIDSSANGNDLFNLSNISIFDDLNNQSPRCTKSNENVTRFFRPFQDYWMYHCLFRNTKTKNFEMFEKHLPVSFRWLLNECAGITEMPVEDLYEEVCLIESYHSYVFNRSNSETKNKREKTDADIIFSRNAILSKW